MDTIAATSTPWSRLSADVAAVLRPVLAQTAREVSAEVTASVPAFAAIGGGAGDARSGLGGVYGAGPAPPGGWSAL